MLKVRLNDKEFAKLKQYTEESGLRSMSEYFYNSILATPIIELGELFRQLALAMPCGERKCPSQPSETAKSGTQALCGKLIT